MIRYLCIKFFAASLLFLTTSFSFGQDEEGLFDIQSGERLPESFLPSIDRMFESNELLKVTIETNLDKLYTYLDDPEYQKGLFRLRLNDSLLVVKKMKIKVSGNSRKKICEVPPLRVDFTKTDFDWQWFKKLSEPKIVNTCQDGKRYQRYLLKEYLAYRIFNVLTESSFRVRLVELTLVDNQNIRESSNHFAFLIEDDKRTEKRFNFKEVDLEQTSTGELISRLYLSPELETLDNINLVSMFQYLIGNTDWSASTLHNVKIFEKEGNLLPIPYDFDYCGFVDAEYAVVSSSIPISDTRDRYYLGPCTSSESLARTMKIFLEKKDEIFSLINSFPYLRKTEREKIISYFDDCYDEISKKSSAGYFAQLNCSG